MGIMNKENFPIGPKNNNIVDPKTKLNSITVKPYSMTRTL